MTPAFSIILPHKRNPGNDDSLAICLDMLTRNTHHDFNLLMAEVRYSLLYETINRLFKQSDTDCCVFWNSDMFPAPNWDVPMLAAFNYHTIVTNILVEPGAISMDGANLQMDFGRKPSTFRRAEFEAWAQAPEREPRGGDGWYAPYMMSRQRFVDLGCMEINTDDVDANGFNARPFDIEMFERHKANGGVVRRAQGSFTYHLQRWSDVNEQTHEKRDRSG